MVEGAYRREVAPDGRDPFYGKLVGLQWGRGLAASLVVITHAIIHPFPYTFETAHLLGRVGVTLFFVISGFIMALTTGQGSFSPFGFMRKRIVRIVPLYYFATALAAIGALVVPWAYKETPFNLHHIMMSLLFIPTVSPGPSASVDPFLRLGWTLNFEMFFYVVFACLFALQVIQRALVLSVLFGLLIAVGLLVDIQNPVLQFYTRVDILGFVAGVWLAVALRRYRWEPSSGTAALGLFAVAASVTLAGVFYHQISANPLTQVWLVATCSLAVGILARVPDSWQRRAPGLLTLLGDASYSIYLFHMFVIGALTVVAKQLLPDLLWPLILLAGIGGILFGIVVYRVVELPLTNWFRRRVESLAGVPASRTVLQKQL